MLHLPGLLILFVYLLSSRSCSTALCLFGQLSLTNFTRAKSQTVRRLEDAKVQRYQSLLNCILLISQTIPAWAAGPNVFYEVWLVQLFGCGQAISQVSEPQAPTAYDLSARVEHLSLCKKCMKMYERLRKNIRVWCFRISSAVLDSLVVGGTAQDPPFGLLGCLLGLRLHHQQSSLLRLRLLLRNLHVLTGGWAETTRWNGAQWCTLQRLCCGFRVLGFNSKDFKGIIWHNMACYGMVESWNWSKPIKSPSPRPYLAIHP